MVHSKGRTFRNRIKKKREQAYSFTNEPCIQQLYVWMRRRGSVMKRMKPAIFNDTGRGLKAYEKVKAGDLLISVPLNILITCEIVMKSYLQNVLLKYYMHLSAMEILSVFLMCEKLQGASSEWNLYINCLPSQYILPAYFPQECLRFIPSIIKNDAKKQAFTVGKTYSKLKPLLKNIERDFPQFYGILTYQLFKWAWASVNTRCVYMKCETIECNNFHCKKHLALAPFLDFLNHSSNVQVTAGFNRETNCYEIVHHNNIQKYEQVFINYGPHGNHKLFLEYGFVVPNNENDQVEFNWDNIFETYIMLNSPMDHTCIREKVTFLNQFNLIRNIGCEERGLTWNFKIVLKVLSSKTCRRKHLQQLFDDVRVIDAEENRIYKRLLFQLLTFKIQEFSISFDNTEMEKLSQVSLDCLKLTTQLCLTSRKILLKNLNF